MAIITQDYENEQQFSNRAYHFFKHYKIGDILRKSNAYKHCGIPVVTVVIYLFLLVFRNRSLNLDMSSVRKSCSFCRDTVYRLKNSLYINWQRFTTLLSAKIITESIQPLTSDERRNVFIIDDTIFERGRSKQVELLSWKFDHARHKTVRGFQLLTLSWSDGVTQIPVNFCLSSSTKEEKRINEAKTVPVNSAAAHRRKLAKMKKTDVVPLLLKEAVSAGISAKYVLFDSWYCIPKVIHQLKSMNLHTVAMVKKGPQKYQLNGKRLNCKELFAAYKKRPGRSKYLLSVVVMLPYRPEKEKDAKERPEEILIPVKLVYVRNRNKQNEYLLLMSTDLSLTAEEIIQLYGKRWGIEVFFKTCKSVLKLTGECHSISYDAMCSHCAIVFARYMLLALEARKEQDPRTAGPIFCLISDEIADVSFQHVFELLQQIWENLLREFKLPEQQIAALFDELKANLPADIAALLGLRGNSRASITHFG